MRTNKISDEERIKAYKSVKKPEVIEKQNINVRYHVEDFETSDLPRRFLEAFAAILKHSNYRMALDHFARMSARYANCSVACQLSVRNRFTSNE